MIPSALVVLDALPLTPNGKVDRQALPVPEEVQEGEQRGQEGARTPMEELLVGIWSEMLGRKQVGIYENFFDLGGHSLLGMQLITHLRDTFQIDLPLRILFEEPTVARLAIVIVQKKAELVDDAFLLDTLEALEQLTHDEVQILLAGGRDQTKKIEEI